MPQRAGDEPPPLLSGCKCGLGWQLALGGIPICWRECNAPEQRCGYGELDADFSGRGFVVGEERHSSDYVLLRGRIDDEQLVCLRHDSFQADEASVGADYGGLGQLVEGRISGAAGDADGHHDVHSFGASLGGWVALGVCYGNASVADGHLSRPPVKVGARTTGSSAGAAGIGMGCGEKVSMTS